MTKELPPIEESLDRMDNYAAESYWETVAERVGPEYSNIALENQRELEKLEKSFIHHNIGEIVISHTAAQSAERWYKKLGSLNSLYGGREKIYVAAATVFFEGRRVKPSFVNLMQEMGRLELPSDPEKTILASQMLLDATHDSVPIGPAELKITSKFVAKANEVLIPTIITTLDKFEALRGQRLLSDTEIREKNNAQRLLSDALKNKFEAEMIGYSAKTPEDWIGSLATIRDKAKTETNLPPARQKFTKLLNRLESQADGQEEMIDALKQYEYFSLIQKQARELENYSDDMRNGDLSEHYFILLTRHATASTLEKVIPVSAAMDRQDRPHDGIRLRHKNTMHLGKLSFDAVVEGFVPHRRSYVQLKAGREVEENEYNDGITIIDPFDVDPNLDKRDANIVIKRQIQGGLKELHSAINELRTGTYAGETPTLDQHVRIITSRLRSKQPIRS